MNPTHPSVDGFIRKNKKWPAELQALRRIILSCPLTEQVKWRTPCYTLDGRNVVMLGCFKESCVISFIKGALLKDAKGLSQKPGENTQAARAIRFTDVRRIAKLKAELRSYILQAINAEASGAKVKCKDISEQAVPEEFANTLDARPDVKQAFESLTPGRRRAYLLYFSGAK